MRRRQLEKLALPAYWLGKPCLHFEDFAKDAHAHDDPPIEDAIQALDRPRTTSARCLCHDSGKRLSRHISAQQQHRVMQQLFGHNAAAYICSCRCLAGTLTQRDEARGVVVLLLEFLRWLMESCVSASCVFVRRLPLQHLCPRSEKEHDATHYPASRVWLNIILKPHGCIVHQDCHSYLQNKFARAYSISLYTLYACIDGTWARLEGIACGSQRKVSQSSRPLLLLRAPLSPEY